MLRRRRRVPTHLGIVGALEVVACQQRRATTKAPRRLHLLVAARIVLVVVERGLEQCALHPAHRSLLEAKNRIVLAVDEREREDGTRVELGGLAQRRGALVVLRGRGERIEGGARARLGNEHEHNLARGPHPRPEALEASEDGSHRRVSLPQEPEREDRGDDVGVLVQPAALEHTGRPLVACRSRIVELRCVLGQAQVARMQLVSRRLARGERAVQVLRADERDERQRTFLKESIERRRDRGSHSN